MIMKTNTYLGYSPNVNFIKFIAATMVILSHAFPLANGSSDKEWFIVLTNNQYSMGNIAVAIFFFYSGLLITKSLEKNSNLKHYTINRLIRILPPLMAVVLLCTFVLGPLTTSLSVSKYFANSVTWRYLLNGLLVLNHNLPGVFENNVYPGAVNGSLWTLPLEALGYIICYIMFHFHLTQEKPMKILMFLAFPCTLAIMILSKYTALGVVYSIVLPVLMFFAGMFYYLLRDKIPMDLKYFILGILIILVTNFTGTLLLGLFIAFPYILAYIGFSCKKLPDFLGNLGKISYGTYLCAFPIQQYLVWYFGGSMNIRLNILLAIPLSMLGGWILYWGIEKKINIKMKKVKL